MRKEPEIITVTLKKQNGMGLSIVAAKVWKSVCVSVMENFFVRFICAFVGEEGGGLIRLLWKMLMEKLVSLEFVVHVILIILYTSCEMFI